MFLALLELLLDEGDSIGVRLVMFFFIKVILKYYGLKFKFD